MSASPSGLCAEYIQAELLPDPLEGLGGIHGGLRADKEFFTGQMCRREPSSKGSRNGFALNEQA